MRINPEVGVEKRCILEGPWVMWGHIDGPLIHWAAHEDWLTLIERLQLWLGLTTIDAIGCKRWPHLATLRARLQINALKGQIA